MIPFYVFVGGPGVDLKRNPGPVGGLETHIFVDELISEKQIFSELT